jgi:hypothetical protein
LILRIVGFRSRGKVLEDEDGMVFELANDQVWDLLVGSRINFIVHQSRYSEAGIQKCPLW